MGTKVLMSVEDFARLPDDDLRHELDEGELISMPPAGEEHGGVGFEIGRLIANHARQHSLGRVYNADTGFILDEETVRAPDVAFVRKERVVRQTGFFRGAPDLAVEVFSPSESVPQLMRKVRQYLRAGTQAVWVVHPDSRQVHVLEASGADRILNVEDVLEAPELLPGFSVRVGDIFE